MATAPDVSKLSYKELQALVEQAQDVIQAKRDEELKVLADGYAKKTSAAGFTPQEAMDALQAYLPQKPRRGPKPGSSPVKYRDPANPENTWSGKGRPARWLQAYLDKGQSKEDFKV